MKTLINLLAAMKSVTGVQFNVSEVVLDCGGEDRAVAVIADAYCKVCRIHDAKIMMIEGAQDLISKNIASYNRASDYD